MVEVVLCPICNSEHHNAFPIEDFNQPQYANLRKSALLADPLAMDAMYHVFLPFAALVSVATEGEQAQVSETVVTVAKAVGFLVAAAEHLGDEQGRAALFKQLFTMGAGHYEFDIDEIDNIDPPKPRERMD